MALINDDVTELIRGIKLSQEGCLAIVSCDAQSLIGCDMNPGILSVVGTIRLAVDLGGIGPEDVLQGGGCLAAQFIAIADKEGAP